MLWSEEDLEWHLEEQDKLTDKVNLKLKNYYGELTLCKVNGKPAIYLDCHSSTQVVLISEELSKAMAKELS